MAAVHHPEFAKIAVQISVMWPKRQFSQIQDGRLIPCADTELQVN